MIRFGEKGGKSREIPVRHDPEKMIGNISTPLACAKHTKDTPLFQSALKKQRKFTGKAVTSGDIYRMMKRRLKDFDMPLLYSPLFPRHDHHRSAGTERAA